MAKNRVALYTWYNQNNLELIRKYAFCCRLQSMIESIYIGSLGAGLILIAFVLGQLHIWKDTYLSYDLLNALGSILLLIYAWIGFSWPFVILNAVWAAISIKDVIVDLKRNTRRKNTMGPWHKWME